MPTKPFCAAFVVLALLATLGARADDHHVATDGSDATGDGSLGAPWASFGHALDRLSPGDRLLARGGVYHEDTINLSLQGTEATPITIQSYPGERATVSHSLPGYDAAPNALWEVVNPAIHLYRTVTTFSPDEFGARLLDDDKGIVIYEDSANFESTNFGPLDDAAPIYIGPGLMRYPDGHVYIRLQLNPNDQTDYFGNPEPPLPADPDPRQNRIALYPTFSLFIMNGSANLIFKDLTFAHAKYLFDSQGDTHDIEFDNCRFDYSQVGIVARDSRDCIVHDCEFDNGMPDYLYWTDVKGGASGTGDPKEAYPEFQSFAISGNMSGYEIYDNTFRHCMDGLAIDGGTRGCTVTRNIFRNTRDDAINIWQDTSDIHVYNNMLWRVATGIAINPNTTTTASNYIHHNVIDLLGWYRKTRPGSSRDARYRQWGSWGAFGSHGGPSVGHWKVYNNTIVSRRYLGSDRGLNPRNCLGSDQKYVFNNVFFAVDDQIVCDDELEVDGAHYDGNVVWQDAPGTYSLFKDWGDGGDYASLADFRASGTTWETNGLEVDPGFDVGALEDNTFDAATVWERYRPTNPAIFTPGAPTGAFDWPGLQGVSYRGALGPAPTPSPSPPPAAKTAHWRVF